MIKSTNISRIVFYGCSFTEGAELSDCELFPTMTQDQIDKLKIKQGYSFYTTIDATVRNKLDNQRSWTRWFADELNKPWINRAVGGSSMGQIIFEIEHDLSAGKILDTDLIIVGITSPERICRFVSNSANSLIIGNTDSRWEDEKFQELFVKHLADDNYILYNWYKDIKYLDLLSNRLGGRLYQQWVWATLEELLGFQNSDKKLCYVLHDYVKPVVNATVTFDSIIDNSLSFTTLNAWNPKNRHAFHHPKIELHKQFSHQLIKSFKDKVKI
jgi:hypothetical protein